MILPFIVFQIAPDTGLIQFGCYDAFAMGILHSAFCIFHLASSGILTSIFSAKMP